MNSLRLRLIVAIAALLLSACQTLPGARSETINGATVQFMTRGHAGPTVVLESGLGDGMEVWAKVVPEVSRFATTFAYNRAGYGDSSRRSEPRTGAQIVAELRSTLQHAGLAPPYVLVGHSLGGTYMELFARSYPSEVAGLVLVESRAASMTRRCREQKLLMCDPPKFLISLLGAAASAEFASTDETFAALERAPPMPAVPLIVLTSTQPRIAEGPNWSRLWQVTQSELARSSTMGQQRTTVWSGHYIQREQPHLVIKAIRDVVLVTRPFWNTIQNTSAIIGQHSKTLVLSTNGSIP
jgi:pimeloyl-ACP methyl ester carboxylesterase